MALDVVLVDAREDEQEELGWVKISELVKAFKHRQLENGNVSPLSEKHVGPSLTSFRGLGYERTVSSITFALPILLKRGKLAFLRQNSLQVMCVGSVLGILIGIGLFFSPLGHDYSSIQSHVGCIQETLLRE